MCWFFFIASFTLLALPQLSVSRSWPLDIIFAFVNISNAIFSFDPIVALELLYFFHISIFIVRRVVYCPDTVQETSVVAAAAIIIIIAASNITFTNHLGLS